MSANKAKRHVHDDIPIIAGWSSVCKTCGCADQDGCRMTLSESVLYMAKSIIKAEARMSAMFHKTMAFCPSCNVLLIFNRVGLFVCKECRSFVYIGKDAECYTEETADKNFNDLELVGVANPLIKISAIEIAP